MESEELQDYLEDYTMTLNQKAYSTVNAYLCGIFKLLEMNRVRFWKAPIKALLPHGNPKKGGGTPYTTEEIERMLEVNHDLRKLAVIHMFNSTGCRAGAFQDQDGYLQMKHLFDMPDGCAALLMYADTSEEYWSFLTPEAYTALKRYHTWREVKGEVFTPESPMFANKHTIPIKPMESEYVRLILYLTLMKAGIKRTKVSDARYDKSTTYGFRLRFNTILKIDNDVNSNIVEKLMAHKRGLDGSYLKPTKEECFAEFRKGINAITISEESKLRIENLKLRDKIQINTKEEVMKVFEAMDVNLDDLKEFVNQKHKDRKYT